MKILLVDDDIYSISALTNLLQYKHTLRIASNGLDAFDSFRSDHYDVVVTDIKMPRMNGLELLKAIRGIDTLISVIIITGHSSAENESVAEKYGVDAFFTKPLDVNRFMDTLTKIENKISKS